MDFLQAIVLSIVEGITEFLPISSTGHLVLASNLLKIQQTEFVKSFEVIIQLGAILAVVVIYWKTLTKNIEIWKRIIIAFLPTAIIGLAFYNVIKSYLLGNIEITLGALFLGGVALLILEKIYEEQEDHLDSIEKLSLKNAFFIGLFQSISMVPGISRAASTIFGGLLLGLKRKTAVEFSFLLAIPTMAAATGLDLLKNDFSFSGNEWSLLGVGLIGSFLTAILAIKLFLRYVQEHSFVLFGAYRITISIIWFLIFI